MMYCRHHEEAPCPECWRERVEDERAEAAKRLPKPSNREQQLCEQLAAAEARIEKLRIDHADMEQWGKEQLKYASKLAAAEASLRSAEEELAAEGFKVTELTAENARLQQALLEQRAPDTQVSERLAAAEAEIAYLKEAKEQSLAYQSEQMPEKENAELREANARLRAELASDELWPDHCRKAVVQLEAENDRLREALATAKKGFGEEK